MPRCIGICRSAAALVGCAMLASIARAEPENLTPSANEAASFGLRGVYFVPNEGQWSDAEVQFGLRSRGLDVAFRPSSFRMQLRRESWRNRGDSLESTESTTSHFETLTLGVTFPGSNAVSPEGLFPQAAKFNYFVGGEGRNPARDVPSFRAVVYRNLYDGIDLHVMGSDDGVLKYEFHVAPGAEYSQIRIEYAGLESLSVDQSSGDLLIETPVGVLRDAAPIAWQISGTGTESEHGDLVGVPAQRFLPARFSLIDDRTYGIVLDAASDPSLPLIIDPEIEWMYYLGGRRDELGLGIAVDRAGDALVTGFTSSTDFVGANNQHHGDTFDAFALKISPSGKLVWMTYLGGRGDDEGLAIAVDDSGDALVTGHTRSGDFVGRNNSYQGGSYDAFALKVSSSGELQWMTYLGGGDEDYGRGVAADSDGNALVTGLTTSIDFNGRNNSYYGGSSDAFALKINPSGELQWMEYLGGRGSEGGNAVGVDGAGNAVLIGSTSSTDFSGRNNSNHGSQDAFALKVASSGQLLWMSYCGGDDSEQAFGIALDGAGNALVTGETRSTDFVGRNNTHNGGGGDAFALKVSPSGQLQWMTYLGGTGREWGYGIAVECGGGSIVTGFTESTDFVGQNNSHHGGRNDAFAVKVSPSGGIESMTHLGGSGDDWGYGIALDGAGNALVTGLTGSTDFANRKNSSYGGIGDAFIARLRLAGPTLSVETSCPSSGPIHITWEGATPGGRVSLLFARETGSAQIPSHWSCPGTELGLGRHQLHVVVKPWSDEFGSGYVDGIAGSIACGGYMQLLDLTCCTTSNVAILE